jgi:hypothetical protein
MVISRVQRLQSRCVLRWSGQARIGFDPRQISARTGPSPSSRISSVERRRRQAAGGVGQAAHPQLLAVAPPRVRGQRLRLGGECAGAGRSGGSPPGRPWPSGRIRVVRHSARYST